MLPRMVAGNTRPRQLPMRPRWQDRDNSRMEALRRGAAMNRDISRGWDHRPHLAPPLEDVRRELGIPPREL